MSKMTKAATDVLAERERQKTVEGWTEEHDDEHDREELADAAACYAMQPAGYGGSFDRYVHPCWPWSRETFKRKTRRDDLVRAGALILAEIERLDRAAARQAPCPDCGGRGAIDAGPLDPEYPGARDYDPCPRGCPVKKPPGADGGKG